MSADVFYLPPGGTKLIYRLGGDKLTELLLELWERWAAIPGQEPSAVQSIVGNYPADYSREQG
jgi:hypothetical protein